MTMTTPYRANEELDRPGEDLTTQRRLADLSTLPTRQRVAERDTAMNAAEAILSAHVPDSCDNTCSGCRIQWDRWIPHADCPQVAWARRVIETFVAWDDAVPSQDLHDVHNRSC